MPTTSSLDSVQPYPSYSVQVAEIIRGAILSGRYDIGQRLNEVELASSLGTSRSPVREALRQLAQEGLVQLVSGRGVFVASLQDDEIRDLLEVRETLDVLAAGLAAQRAADEELDRLARILDDYTAALHHSDTSPELPWASDFHLGIYEAAHNRKLYDQGRMVHTQLRLARFRSGATQDRTQHAHEEHTTILEALRARDPSAARRRMRQHLDAGSRHILALLSEESSK